MKHKRIILYCIIILLVSTKSLYYNKRVLNYNIEEEVAMTASRKQILAFNQHIEDKTNKINEKLRVGHIEEINKKQPVIVIDPGHTGKMTKDREPIYPGSSETKRKESGGAVGIATKIPEYKTVMEISLRLKEILEEKGYKVIMTRIDHEVILGNIERARIGNDANADLVIRVHADSTSNQGVYGASMLIPENNKRTGSIYEKSKQYGEIIMKELVDEVGMKNRGIITRDDLTGFNWSKVPVVLLEAGFLSNYNEDRMLNSPEYQIRIAKGIAKGIGKAIPIEVQD